MGWTAASEGIVAEIDDRVPLAAPDVREHQLPLERRVRGDRAEGLGQQQQRLVAEGAAAVEPADVFLTRREPHLDRVLGPCRASCGICAAGKDHGEAGGVLQRAHRMHVLSPHRVGMRAEKIHHDRLAGARRRAQDPLRDRGMGGLEISTMTRVAGRRQAPPAPGAW